MANFDDTDDTHGELPENFSEISHEFHLLQTMFVSVLLKAGSATQAIQHLAEHGAVLAPNVAKSIHPDTGPLACFFRNMARSYANHCPNPHANFMIQKLPVPQRNEPCYCGSLRKYKHCCVNLPDFPCDSALMLSVLLESMPVKHWANLVGSAINLQLLESVVRFWLDKDQLEDIVALLEPWFSKSRGFSASHLIPNSHAPLLDILLDAYLRLNKPRKRMALAKMATEFGAPEVRHVGWCRIALISMDNGDLVTMAHAFQQAQRAVPNHPLTALLEVQLLVAQENYALARSRAAFWLSKLRHSPYDAEGILPLLHAVIENPKTAIANSLRTECDDLKQIEAMLAQLSGVEKHYKYDVAEGQIMIAGHDAALSKAYSVWAKLPMLEDSALLWEDLLWLDVLMKYPILWQCFEVLDDITQALNMYPVDHPEVTTPLQLRIVEHALTLFKFNFGKKQQLPKAQFVWGFLQHRPALRLLHHFVLLAEETESSELREQAFLLKGHLVQVLNPNDNQGLRTSLVKDFLMRGALDDALKLTKQYPDDFADMQYTTSLVLFLSKHKAADSTLQKAIKKYPLVADMLLAKNPKAPTMQPYTISLGGKDEAWMYRMNYLDVWEQSAGALVWLKQLVSISKAM